MSYLKFIIFFFFTISNIYAQEDWINYVVKKKKGIMSITIDMDLAYKKPNYKNLLIVGTSFRRGCLNNGFPNEEGLKKLSTFSDSSAIIINKLTKNRLVGIITYQCMGLDVFYVKDTLGIRKNLNELFDKSFKNTAKYIFIEFDKKWNYYKKNLYPEFNSDDFFIDQQFLSEMVFEGDDLTEKRNLTHWFYFNKLKKRNELVDVLKKYNFSIDSLNFKKENRYPYELQVSHKTSIEPESIIKLTETLKVYAEIFKGQYDGWSLKVIEKSKEF
ncbi:MAG: DUF695 domain-containing protein [Bacteroidota bacterium]